MMIRAKRHSFIFVTMLFMLTACSNDDSSNTGAPTVTESETPVINVDINSLSGILVKFNASVNYENQQSILEKNGLKEVQNYSFLSGLIYAESNNGNSIEETLSQLKNNENIVYAEADYEISTSSFNTESNTAIQNKVNARESTNENDQTIIQPKTNAIGILDTGIDFTHNSLSENMWINVNETPLNGIDDDHNGWVDDIYGWNFVNNHNNPIDDNNHGTHIAGIVTGNFNNNVNTANQGIKLVALKVLDRNGKGNISSLLGAFDYMVKNDISISNNSWGLELNSEALKDALQQLAQTDHLLIVAAGNKSINIDDTPFYPASYNLANIITVSALDESGKLAEFSNYGGKTVHVGANGAAITSTGINNSVTTLSGTSMAAAFVSGVAIRVQEEIKDVTSQEIKTWLINHAEQDDTLNDVMISASKLENLDVLLADIQTVSNDVTIDVSIETPIDNTDVDDAIIDINVPNTNSTETSNNTPDAATDIPSISVDNTSISINEIKEITIAGGIAPFTFSTSDSNVAMIDESGFITALTAGTAEISLTDANGLNSNTITLNVVELKILPENINQVAIQDRLTLNVSNGLPPYSWFVSDESIAAIVVNENDDSEIELRPSQSGTISITVQDATGNNAIIDNIQIDLPQLIVNPSAINLNRGQNILLRVDGGTSPYSYQSSDENIVVIDDSGMVSALVEGSASITVTDSEGQVGLASIIVNPNLTVSTAKHILDVNETITIDALGAVGSLSWASSNSMILSVDQTGLVSAQDLPGTAIINVMDAAGRRGSVLIEVRQVTLTSPSSTVVVGDPAMQLNAQGGSTPYSWSVDDPTVAQINLSGFFSGIKAGSVIVTATDADGFSSTISVTVDPAPLSVSQTNLVLAMDGSVQLTANGAEENYTWTSNDENVVTVDNNGLVQAVALGLTEIILTDSSGEFIVITAQVREIGLSVSSTSIYITDPGLRITTNGGIAPFVWISNDPSIATIDSTGFLRPLSLGDVTISVSDANLITASINISIDVLPLSVTPANIVMGLNQSLQLSPTGGDNRYSWSSDNTGVADVDQNGYLSAISVGNTIINLVDGVNQSTTASVAVRDLTLTIPNNTITIGDPSMTLTVYGGLEPYTWRSSDANKAQISSDGILTPIAAGNVTITATDTDGILKSATITINDPVLVVNNNNLLLGIGDSYNIVATGGTGNYSWISTDNNIVSVDSIGRVTGLNPGTTTITLSDDAGSSINIYVEIRSVSINTTTTNIVLGDSMTLSATGGSAPYTWSSSNNAILSVDNNGLITANGIGSAAISVSDNNGFNNVLLFTVNTNNLTISNTSAILAVSGTLQLTANGGDGNYTWSSSNSSVASVSLTGLVSADSVGISLITVQDGLGNTQNTAIEIRQVNLSASSTNIVVGESPLQVSASGGNSPYTWSSSNTTIATVDNNGLVTAVSNGTVNITVTDSDDFSAQLTLSVTMPQMTINQSNSLIGIGDNVQLIASGGDGNFTWTSSNTGIATVDQTGLVTGISAGNVTITATDGLSAVVTSSIEVRDVTISSTTTNLVLGVGTVQLTANGGNGPYNWSSSNTNIASVNNSGLVTPVSGGNVVISAVDNDGFSSTKSITVSVTPLTINQSNVIIEPNNTVQLTANGGDSNYSWSTSNNNIASVDSNGRVTGNNTGTVTITVQDGLNSTQTTTIEVREIIISSSTSILSVGDNDLQLNVSGGNGPYNWSSSNTNIARVDGSGSVTAISSGNVTITATDNDGFRDTISLSITVQNLSLSTPNNKIGENDSIQLSASGGDGDYTWSSSNTSVASVSSSGRVTANNGGQTTITVTDGLGNSQTETIEVVEINISSSYNYLYVGYAMQLNASGGNGPYDWSSSNTNIARIGSNGVVGGYGEGTVTITATDDDGFRGTFTFTVYRQSSDGGDGESDNN